MNTKRSLILLGMLLFLGFSCTQEDANPLIEEQGARFEEHTLHSVPGLADFLGPYVNYDYDLTLKASSSPYPQEESIFSQSIDYKNVLARYDEIGYVNYAMPVEDYDGNPFTFTNLIIGKNENDIFQTPYLLRYTMDEDYIPVYLNEGHLENFKGSIHQYILGPMKTSGPRSRNADDYDPQEGDNGPEEGSGDPAHDANVVCEKEKVGSGGSGGGDGDNIGRTVEVCEIFLNTVYSTDGHGNRYVFRTYLTFENCQTVAAEQAASGSTNCSDPSGEGEIPIVDPKEIDDYSGDGDLGDGDDYFVDCTSHLMPIPTGIKLNNGEWVAISFGWTSDNSYADKPVSQSLVNALIHALNQSNELERIQSVHISATSNGKHSPTSNHYKNIAFDISRINGNSIYSLRNSDMVKNFQNGFDDYHDIRENYGPYFQHKLGENNYVGGHLDHIHVSVNGCF